MVPAPLCYDLRKRQHLNLWCCWCQPNWKLILLKWHGEQRAYSVAAVKSVSPDDVCVLYPTEQEQLTLITCGDYDFFSNTYRERIVVVTPRVS